MHLDLFSTREVRKATATILIFPTDRRAALVRETASELLNRPYASGKRWWATHARKMRRELSGAGLGRSEINAHLASYSRAVASIVLGHAASSADGAA